MERSLSLTSNSSTLSTPELSPHFSDSDSSNDGGSFFSALSSTDDAPHDVMVASPPSVGFPSLDSERVDVKPPFRRPAPLPLFDIPLPSPIASIHRKLKKSKPKDATSETSPSNSLFSRPVNLLRRATGYEPMGRKRRPRRSSLPSIPSASLSQTTFREQIITRTVKFQSPSKEREVSTISIEEKI